MSKHIGCFTVAASSYANHELHEVGDELQVLTSIDPVSDSVGFRFAFAESGVFSEAKEGLGSLFSDWQIKDAFKKDIGQVSHADILTYALETL